MQVMVVVLGVGLVAAVRVTPPPDVGTWAPGALPGDAVLALAPVDDGALVGTGDGLYLIAPDGPVRDLAVGGPVRALAPHPRGTYVGTDDGLLDLATGTLTPRAEPELTGTAVTAVDARSSDRVLVGASTGLLQQTEDGWERLWPAAGKPAQAVDAVLAVRGGILFAQRDGLALRGDDGRVRLLRPDVVVVSFYDDPVAGLLWAGTRGAPLLLVSRDDGRTWQPSAEGLGFSAVETLVRPPGAGAEGPLVAGGSGLADGTGNAGTQTSTDGGRTWQARQDRLSNTHVYALVARREPWRVEVSLAGIPASRSIPLPTGGSRLYAGTNGGGVSTYRPAEPLVAALAPTIPVLRLIEPLLAGVLLLACLLPAYRHLWRNSAPSPHPPPTAHTAPSGARRPPTDDPTHP